MANDPSSKPQKTDPSPTKIEEMERSGRRMIKELDLKSEQLAIINGVLRLVAREIDIKDVLQVFGNNLKNLCPYDQITIALFDGEKNKFLVPFLLKVGRVLVNKDIQNRVVTDESMLEVVNGREPVLRRHLKPEEMSVKGDTTFVKRALSCELMIPLTVGERQYGILTVSCFDPESMRDEHKGILWELAPAVSIAIHEFLRRNGGRIPYPEMPEGHEG